MLYAKDKAFWQEPAWYRALSLTERLASYQAETGDIASTSTRGPTYHHSFDATPPSRKGPQTIGRFPPRCTSEETDDGAVSRLQDWQAQPAFKQKTLFAERLAQDGLSEQDLLALLAEPMARLQARVSATPYWLTALMAAFTDAQAVEKMLPLLQKAGSDHPLSACLPAISPLLQHSLTSLQEELQALQQQYPFVPFHADLLSQIFLKNIGYELLFEMSKPVILEMHIARLQERLQGETSEERFADFVRQLSEEGLILPLLAKYPVLARQLVMTIEHSADYAREFLTHLCADWDAICTTFAPGSDPGSLVEVQAGMGDRHRRGRSVLLLQFSSGMQLLYKPKPLAADMHFQELLAWLNERGAAPPLRALKLIDRGDYGWSEFVVASPCASQDEVARFYERQGSYLALLYALDAVDLHNDNVIAVGEHPMLVDLEALFHPRIEGDDPTLVSNLAARAMDRSVWQVGLLPRRLWSDKDSPGVDMSGLGGQPGQMLPHPLFRWQETGTDQMRLVRQRVEMPVGQNRPRLNDQEVDVLDYKDAVTAGFKRMYRLLYDQRDALLSEQLPRFATDEIRVLMRSTRIYATLLFESFHPDLLHDALERDRFFDSLWREVEHRPYLARIIPAERHDLLRGDIPSFTTFPDSRTIFTSEKQPLVDFLDTPSLELVRQRIQQLDERDLATQTWIIEASLATLRMGRADTIEQPLPIKPVDYPVKRGHLLGLAKEAGKRLREIALQNDAGAYWLGVNYVDEHIWGLFPTGTDLYNGTSGIALFLGYLGAITGEPSYTLVAKRSLASIRMQIEEQQKYSTDSSIGAFDGLGSVIYLLTHLGVLWNDPALFQEAEALAERLTAFISKDDHRDIINGAAGCILSLLSLYAVHSSLRVLEIAVQCGDHLLATAQPMHEGIAWETLKGERPLGGFSHGTAGITFSLLNLAASSGQERFRHVALSALAYDRSLFVPVLNNWADLRVFSLRRPDPEEVNEPPAETSQKSMVAWCHGAPGIGLGRLGALAQLEDAKVREEIDIALSTTIRQGFAGNHSLCHGALGNLELLVMAAQVLGRPADQEALEQATAVIVGSIEANGWVSAVPLRVETPGLMIGLAGIGYQLLRLAKPDKVPSVLLLAPPCSHSSHISAEEKGECCA